MLYVYHSGQGIKIVVVAALAAPQRTHSLFLTRTLSDGQVVGDGVNAGVGGVSPVS